MTIEIQKGLDFGPHSDAVIFTMESQMKNFIETNNYKSWKIKISKEALVCSTEIQLQSYDGKISKVEEKSECIASESSLTDEDLRNCLLSSFDSAYKALEVKPK